MTKGVYLRKLETGDKISQTRRHMFALGLLRGFPVGRDNPMYGIRKCGSENPFFGRHHSEKTKRKLHELNICKKHTLGSRKKMSIKQQERFRMKGQKQWNTGKPMSNDLKSYLSVKNSGVGNPFYGKQHTFVAKKKMSLSKLGKKLSFSTRVKMSNGHLGLRLSELSKRKILKKVNRKPNKFESDVAEWLNAVEPDVWKYCGNGLVFINGFCPDFIRTDGTKSVLLANGLYWHALRHPKKTVDGIEKIEACPYEEAGYNVRFIWYHEFYGVKR